MEKKTVSHFILTQESLDFLVTKDAVVILDLLSKEQYIALHISSSKYSASFTTYNVSKQ